MAVKTKTVENDTSASSLADRLDRDLAAKAYRKVMQGQEPTARERAALKRFEKEQEEQRRWQYYENIPKKHWRQMSGRQTKVINEQAALYGLPFGGPKINLPEFVAALHNFLAINARKLSAPDDELMQGDSSSAALEQYRRERAKLARLDRLERERTLVQRDQVREGLGRIAAILRTAGQAIERQHGTEAGALLAEAIGEAKQEIDRAFGDQSDNKIDKT